MSFALFRKLLENTHHVPLAPQFASFCFMKHQNLFISSQQAATSSVNNVPRGTEFSDGWKFTHRGHVWGCF